MIHIAPFGDAIIGGTERSIRDFSDDQFAILWPRPPAHATTRHALRQLKAAAPSLFIEGAARVCVNVISMIGRLGYITAEGLTEEWDDELVAIDSRYDDEIAE